MADCVCLIGGAGTGKCLGRDTPILLWDGRIIPVQDIKPFHVLMGPDSLPRRIQNINQGRGELFRIIPIKGDPWICNGDHILTLTGTNRHIGQIIDISVNDHLAACEKSVRWKSDWKLFRVPILEFTIPQTLPIPAYLLGIWMGDGSRGSASITNQNPIIHEYCRSIAEDFGLNCTVTPDARAEKNTSRIAFQAKLPKHGANVFFKFFQTCSEGVVKKIPHKYLTASIENRRELLAGILDTDGEQTGNSHTSINVTGEPYRDGLLFLCRSLGIAAYATSSWQHTCASGKVSTYLNISIAGDLNSIPTKIKKFPPRRQIKRPLVTGFSIEPIGEGNYYGFTLDGDGRFLLGDFTVTHNTTALMDLIDRLRAEDVPLWDIGFCSYTRAARATAVERAAARFGVEPDQLAKDGWFRTLHSICYRILGLNSKQCLTKGKDVAKWFETHFGEKLEAEADEETPLASGFSGAGESELKLSMALWNVCRQRLETLHESWVRAEKSGALVPSEEVCVEIIQRYEQLKRLDGLSDFTDWLGAFAGVNFMTDGHTDVAPRGDVPVLTAWILDEMQDNSALMDRCFRRLVEPVRWGYLAGDPFQCLTKNSTVQFEDGRVLTIQNVVENRIVGRVLSMNLDSMTLEWKEITGWHSSPLGNRKIMEVGDLRCTEDHKVFSCQGYKSCIELNNLEVVSITGTLDVIRSTEVNHHGIAAWRWLSVVEQRDSEFTIHSFKHALAVRRLAVWKIERDNSQRANDCRSEGNAAAKIRASVSVSNSQSRRTTNFQRVLFQWNQNRPSITTANSAQHCRLADGRRHSMRRQYFIQYSIVQQNRSQYTSKSLAGVRNFNESANGKKQVFRSNSFVFGLLQIVRSCCRACHRCLRLQAGSTRRKVRHRHSAIDAGLFFRGRSEIQSMPPLRRAVSATYKSNDLRKKRMRHSQKYRWTSAVDKSKAVRDVCLRDLRNDVQPTNNLQKHADSGDVQPTLPRSISGAASGQRIVLQRSHPQPGDGTVYCIDVAGNYNFFANGILVHNCVYSFSGSDPLLFQSWPFQKTRVMEKSHRCPSKILELGEACIRPSSGYWDRGIKPVADGGEIYSGDLGDALAMLCDPKSSDTWLLLARTNWYAHSFIPKLKSLNVPYVLSRGGSPWAAPIRNGAFYAMLMLQRGYSINEQEWADILRLDGLPVKFQEREMLVHGTKADWKKRELDLESMQDLNGIGEWGATIQLCEIIQTGMWVEFFDFAREFVEAIDRFGHDRVFNPTVTISTIHSAKGAEATNVVLLTAIPQIVHNAMAEQTCYDEECRLAYVGVTRAKQRLWIVDDYRARYKMEIPV